MSNDDPREPDEPKDNGFPIGVVIGIVVTVLLIGSLITYVNAVTSTPPAGPGSCSTACTMWVKIDCPGGKVLAMCSWDHPITTCGPPVHACGVNPPYPP